ncbi:hypothetical protein [Halarsenatibacter silvermanii]|uniref:Uncharacterized protein n=1 Tax=Halarsenatibacter silvermanii TaxID=321763 RepID=A0A1G9RCN2_9FIRM|nr:hypothetical protein [Halarsenatibacter silvermanii]SDM20988.1 hypothetical protein SAMN04488692_12139 [Halarsenatibacter silvermanii]
MAKSIGRIKKVKVDIIEGDEVVEKKYIIKKAGLGKYKKLTGAFAELLGLVPQVLEERGIEDTNEYLENMSIVDMLDIFPELFGYGVDQLAEVVAVILDEDEEFVSENIGLDEAVDIVEVALEVNNLKGLAAKAKNLLGGAKIEGLS